MAATVTKVDVWMAEISDQVGATDRVLEALADAGVNLECIIGRRKSDKPGYGQLFVAGIKGKRAQDAARSVGLTPADLVTLRVETANKAGKAHAIMQNIADAGVNVRGISMIGMGAKAVAYIGLDSKEDADRAVKAAKKAKA